MGRSAVRLLVALALFPALCPSIYGQDDVAREYGIGQVTVTGRRLSQIGATVTDLDTFALRDNISQSLADVLSQNTAIYIKQYGRGTMASASFRGTAPSHTQVLWNGMKINSPMLGMTDFSQIPSYFIDRAAVLHGAASVDAAGGGLGGAVVLGNAPAGTVGPALNYIQGISSFGTWDQFLKFTYGTSKLRLATRVNYVTSRNDFKFTNYDKRPLDNGKYPVERSRNSRFRDLHVMQEVYYDPGGPDTFSAALWFMDSRRGIPRITVDYSGADQANNKTEEQTWRFVGSWKRRGGTVSMQADAGYIYSDMKYKYFGVVSGPASSREMIYSRSVVYTGHARYGLNWSPAQNLFLSANATVDINRVENQEKYTRERYDKLRAESSLSASVKYKPAERLGLGAEMRQESYGSRFSPPIYSGFADLLLWPKYQLALKASAARNYRQPTLNDLYFKPGGNPDLIPEKGYTYEGGLEFRIRKNPLDLHFEATAYDSRIRDWILWETNFQGIWTPRNVKKVHSYGLELKASASFDFNRDWTLRVDGLWSLTPSINYGEPRGEDDRSVGRQLVYVPRRSNAVMGKLAWRSWAFTYKYNYYSRRYTTTDNQASRLNHVGAYYMSDISLERDIRTDYARLSLKVCINNLFNEEYVSVLSRPMARRNYGLFIGITPNLKKRPAAHPAD